MGECANKSTQLDIDHEILDYLLYKAIKALLAGGRTMERKDNGIVKQIDGHSLCLQMLDSFLGIFRSIHPNQPAPTDIQFRLCLLRFTSMFTACFALTSIEPPPTRLRRVRWQNKENTNEFHQTSKSWHVGELGVMDREASKRNKVQKTQNLNPASGEISLLDTLPSFMALSAAQSVLQDRPITDIWMRLAAGFMAHAAIEQYLVYGMPLSDAIRAAFAWGFDAESTAQEGSEDWQINAMFLGEDEEVLGWSEIKDEHMQALSPPTGTSTIAHIQTLLADELPLDSFEQSLVSFVESLLDAQPKPLYVQIELGKLNALSRVDGRLFRNSTGLA